MSFVFSVLARQTLHFFAFLIKVSLKLGPEERPHIFLTQVSPINSLAKVLIFVTLGSQLNRTHQLTYACEFTER
jgi:hypothetical protein